METVAIIISLLGTSAILAYISSQFKSSSEGGSKYASVMKILFNAISFVVLLLVPGAGIVIADSTSLPGLKTIMATAQIPVMFLFVVFVFYLLWEYFSELVELMIGKNSEMSQDDFR